MGAVLCYAPVAADLGVTAPKGDGHRVAVADLSIPVRETRCAILDGDTADEKVDLLLRRLQELKLL